MRQRFGFFSKPEEEGGLGFSSHSKAPIDYVSVSPNKTVNVKQYKAM